jgi:hypothetical protein
MCGKMNKKGIFFSITALHFVALFLLFLSIFVLLTNKVEIIDSVESLYYRTKHSLYDGLAVTPPYTNNGWCSTQLVYDPESNDLDAQSDLQIKEYCENYAK